MRYEPGGEAVVERTYLPERGVHQDQPMSVLVCPHCMHLNAVTGVWRRAHIGERFECWECRRWADIPVMQHYE